MSRPAQWKADALLALVALVWGVGFVVMKQSLREITTLYLLSLRFSVAAVCMFPLLIRVPAGRRLRSVAWGSLVGVLLAAGYIFQTYGLLFTTPGNSGFITGLYIPLVPVLLAIFKRQMPSSRETWGILLAFVGMSLLSFPALDGHLRFNFGDALTLGCAAMFACHILSLGVLSKLEPAGGLAFGQIAAVALVSGAGLRLEPPRVHWSGPLLLAIGFMAVAGTALAFLIQTWAQQFTSSTRAALIFSVEPVFALVASVLAGTEELTRGAVVGGTLILGGIVLIQTERPPVAEVRLE